MNASHTPSPDIIAFFPFQIPSAQYVSDDDGLESDNEGTIYWDMPLNSEYHANLNN